jgi:hypothetical protein
VVIPTTCLSTAAPSADPCRHRCLDRCIRQYPLVQMLKSSSRSLYRTVEAQLREDLRNYGVELRQLAYTLPEGVGEHDLLGLSGRMRATADQVERPQPHQPGIMPAVGDLVRCTDGSWMTRPPQSCPHGHRLRPGAMLVGHQPCSTCRVDTRPGRASHAARWCTGRRYVSTAASSLARPRCGDSSTSESFSSA